MAEQVLGGAATLTLLVAQLWAYRKTKLDSLAVLVLASFIGLLALFFSLLSRVPSVHAICFYASMASWLVAIVLSVAGSVGLLRWVVMAAPFRRDT